MKIKILGFLLAGLVQVAVASNFAPGMYLGAQGGYSLVDEGNALERLVTNYYDFFSGVATKAIHQGGLGGRGFLGYNLTPYLAFETGYAYFHKNHYQFNATATNIVTNTNIDAQVPAWALDVVMKGILPLDNFSMYGKVGGAYVNTKLDLRANYMGVNYRNNAIRPVYGLGFMYDITDNLSLDVAWSLIPGKAKLENVANLERSNDFIPSCQLYSLGLVYKFIGL